MRYLLILIFCLSVSSCSGDWTQYPEEYTIVEDQVTFVRPGDDLRIIVYGEDRISGTYNVAEDGSIQLPLLGLIELRQLTPVLAAGKIRSNLIEKGLMIDPQVNVAVNLSRNFLIMGEVVKGGEYTLKPGMTILDAVARAEGFSYRANQDSFEIVRKQLDGKDLVLEANIATRLKSGDIIRVRERYF